MSFGLSAPPTGALIHLHAKDPPRSDAAPRTWASRLSGALEAVATAAPGCRVYVMWTGGWADATPTRETITELSLAYDCTPLSAPQLDVVPLQV